MTGLKQRLGLVFDSLLVLSFQVVFRAMNEARRWNY